MEINIRRPNWRTAGDKNNVEAHLTFTQRGPSLQRPPRNGWSGAAGSMRAGDGAQPPANRSLQQDLTFQMVPLISRCSDASVDAVSVSRTTSVQVYAVTDVKLKRVRWCNPDPRAGRRCEFPDATATSSGEGSVLHPINSRSTDSISFFIVKWLILIQIIYTDLWNHKHTFRGGNWTEREETDFHAVKRITYGESQSLVLVLSWNITVILF